MWNCSTQIASEQVIYMYIYIYLFVRKVAYFFKKIPGSHYFTYRMFHYCTSIPKLSILNFHHRKATLLEQCLSKQWPMEWALYYTRLYERAFIYNWIVQYSKHVFQYILLSKINWANTPIIFRLSMLHAAAYSIKWMNLHAFFYAPVNYSHLYAYLTFVITGTPIKFIYNTYTHVIFVI